MTERFIVFLCIIISVPTYFYVFHDATPKEMATFVLIMTVIFVFTEGRRARRGEE